MARIDGEIVIGRPVDVVFDYVADQRNEPQYNPQMVRAEKITAGPVGKGTRFRSAVTSMGRTAEMLIECTGYDTAGPVRHHHDHAAGRHLRRHALPARQCGGVPPESRAAYQLPENLSRTTSRAPGVPPPTSRPACASLAFRRTRAGHATPPDPAGK